MEKICISSEKRENIKDYVLECKEIIIDLEGGGELSQRLMEFLNTFTCVKKKRYKYYNGEVIYISYKKENDTCVMAYNCGTEKNIYFVKRDILLEYLDAPYEIIMRNSSYGDRKIVFHIGLVNKYDLYQKDKYGMWKLLKKKVQATEIVDSLSLKERELFESYLPF